MGIIDFILNLAGLLLWLNWRTLPLDALSGAAPGTLAGTLRRAERKKLKRWHFPLALALLLLIRAALYRMIGPAVNWTAQLDLGVVTIPFRSDYFWRILAFSSLSFAVTLTVFLLWMVLLSVMDCGEPLRRLVKLQLGRVDGWPKWARVSLPFAAVGLAWWGLSWPLTRWGFVPPPLPGWGRLTQAALVGLESYLAWKFVIGGALLLHLLDSYIYFGSHAFWECVRALAKTFLQPLRRLPSKISKVDFAPVIGIVFVFLLANVLQNGLKLPPWAEETAHDASPPPKIPGLIDLYKRTH